MSFNDWTNKKYMLRAYEAGAASRQGEIDELRKSNHHLYIQVEDGQDFYDYEKSRADELKKELDILQGMHNAVSLEAGNLVDERDELQKRIDKALEKCYTGIRKQGGDYYLELVEEILKGQNNG